MDFISSHEPYEVGYDYPHFTDGTCEARDRQQEPSSLPLAQGAMQWAGVWVESSKKISSTQSDAKT